MNIPINSYAWVRLIWRDTGLPAYLLDNPMGAWIAHWDGSSWRVFHPECVMWVNPLDPKERLSVQIIEQITAPVVAG